MEKIKDIEYYLRLNLLNIEGVTPFLQSIVLKIASLTYGNNIEGVLALFKNKLEKVVKNDVTKESFKLLFPIDGTPSNVSKWDITLTSSVLLNCFTIERKLDKLRRVLKKDMKQTGNKNDLREYRRAKESDLFAAQGQRITATQYRELSDAETVEELGVDLIICMVLICGSEESKDNLYDICKNILFQEIELDFNNRTSVNSYLNKKRRKIEVLKNDLTIFDSAFKRLYPDNGPSDFTTWNKNILVLFVLNACERLSRTSQGELKKIRNIRNQMAAHKGKAELTFKEFLPIWTDLFSAIKSLLKEEGLNVKEFEERVKYFKDGDLDVQSAIDILKKHYMEETNEYQVLKTTFGDIEERIVEKMKTYQGKVRSLLESTNSKIRDFGSSMDSFVQKRTVVVYNHEMEIPCVDVKIVVKGNDKRAVAKAHTAIIEAMKDPTGVERKKKKAIGKILDIIERDGSTVIEVRKGSVIASVKCRDLEGVSSLLIYVGSEDWADAINELITDIGQELNRHFVIETNITEESIEILNDDIEEKDNQYEEIPPLTFEPLSTNEVSNETLDDVDSDSNDEPKQTPDIADDDFQEKLTAAYQEAPAKSQKGVRMPINWRPMQTMEVDVVKLETSDAAQKQEYAEVEKHFKETLEHAEVKVIKRVQNPLLWEHFRLKKREMESKYGQGCVNELHLYHGTSPDIVDIIAHGNFDFRIAGSRVGVLYGHGSYFATTAKYTDPYASPDDKTGLKVMLLAKVLVGKTCLGAPGLQRPPQVDPDDFRKGMYDAVVNNELNPTIYCVFDMNQYYPEYIIEYK